MAVVSDGGVSVAVVSGGIVSVAVVSGGVVMVAVVWVRGASVVVDGVMLLFMNEMISVIAIRLTFIALE